MGKRCGGARPANLAMRSVVTAISLAVFMGLSGCGSGATGSQRREPSGGGQESSRRLAHPPPDREARSGLGTTNAGSSVVRSCESRVEGTTTPTKYDVVAGPVTFYNLRQAARERPPFFRRRDGGYPTWKTVIAVEADATVMIVAEDERRLGLNYDGTGGYVVPLAEVPSGMTFDACPSSEPRVRRQKSADSTKFNGGFVSAGPGCRSFRVIAEKGADPIRVVVGFGTDEDTC